MESKHRVAFSLCVCVLFFSTALRKLTRKKGKKRKCKVKGKKNNKKNSTAQSYRTTNQNHYANIHTLKIELCGVLFIVGGFLFVLLLRYSRYGFVFYFALSHLHLLSKFIYYDFFLPSETPTLIKFLYFQHKVFCNLVTYLRILLHTHTQTHT